MREIHERHDERTAVKLQQLSDSLQEAVLDDSVEMEIVQRHASNLIALAFKEKERRLFNRQFRRSQANAPAKLN